ncbi:MAG: type II toxin-antitoxin system VapC family toxin [Deltaproteobacteria bacterium]|nr:type II toxin-antitoxin system VapC family toxin [Deltaproteobacteria bacterium]
MDTSVIVKLYFKEEYSRDTSNWLRKNNEAIPLTSFHELELINAIQLKQFRTEITPDETRQIMSRFEEHEIRGIYYRPQLAWSAIFIHAIDLSKKHSASIGSRSLDILHVASAVSINAERFLTLDDRQTRLATLAGLKIENIKK